MPDQKNDLKKQTSQTKPQNEVSSEILKKRLLYIGSVWPEPKSSAAGVRTKQILKGFLKDEEVDWEILYVSPSSYNEFSRALNELGIETIKVPSNDSMMQRVVRNFQPNYVIYDRFVVEEQYGWRVREAAPEVFEILDTQDLHSLRRNRAAVMSGKPEDSKLVSRELASMLKCHWSWVVSDYEKKILIDQYQIPEQMVSHVPFGPEKKAENILPFRGRKNIAFIGNYRHEPNRDAILWFVETIWKKISGNLKGVELHLYGSYIPKEISELDSSENKVRVMGWCDEVSVTLSRYLLSVAPLRFGAGIKGKVLESWNVGTPVVGTEIAFEGMGDLGNLEELQASQMEDWSVLISSLMTDPIYWEKMSLLSQGMIEKRFSPTRIFDLIQSELQDRQKKTQPKNWYREVLMMESFERSKYFSKWIELKNESSHSKSSGS